MLHLFGSPTSGIGKQTEREEDCSETLTQKRLDEFFDYLLNYIIVIAKGKKNQARYWNLEDTQKGEYGAKHAVAETGREQGKCHSHHLH